MRGMPLWLFSMRVRQLIVHPREIRIPRNEILACCNRLWNRHGRMAICSVRLESAIEQLDRDERAAIERNAAKLSVKLLMPTGLCFLPAFVLVGVIPAIASFMM